MSPASGTNPKISLPTETVRREPSDYTIPQDKQYPDTEGEGPPDLPEDLFIYFEQLIKDIEKN